MKRKVCRVSVVLLILLSPWAFWRLALLWDVHAKLASIRKIGLPANAREVDEWYAGVPAAENAGLMIHRAAALCDLRADSIALQKLKMPAAGEAFSREALQDLEALLKVHKKDLRIVDEALGHSRSRYPIDLTMAMATRLPDLAYAKNFALLYQASAALALQRGKLASASSNVVKCVLLARTLDKEPTLISGLVRLKILDIAMETLRRRIDTAPLASEEIEQLNAAIQSAPNASDQLVHALVGERALLLEYFELSEKEAAKILKPPGDDPIAASTFPHKPSLVLRVAGFYDLTASSFFAPWALLSKKLKWDRRTAWEHPVTSPDRGRTRFVIIISSPAAPLALMLPPSGDSPTPKRNIVSR